MSYQHADLIIPRLWIGNKFSSTDAEFLKANKIDTVFNCTKDLPFSPLVPHKYRIPVDDNLQPAEIANMAKWSPEIAYKMIREYKRGGRILVHCHAGMQRSAASVAIMLIAMTGKPSSWAIPFIRSRRSVTFFPAVNFRNAILAFEKQYFLQRGTGGSN